MKRRGSAPHRLQLDSGLSWLRLLDEGVVSHE